jgi:hypothetical protein
MMAGPTVGIRFAGERQRARHEPGCASGGYRRGQCPRGGTINLAQSAANPLGPTGKGGNGLPVVTTRIAVNGHGATIDGTGAVRALEVDGPGGNLSLQYVTVTGGSADVGGGIEMSAARSR